MQGQPSVTKIVDTVSGFPEISYWRDEYFCKKASTENQAKLCSVEFSNPASFNNFEELFNITQGASKGYADPLPSSLFNVKTLKRLIKAGEGSVDITDPEFADVAFEDAIKGQRDLWLILSKDLGYCTTLNPNDCDNKHVYMIYLWLDTLY